MLIEELKKKQELRTTETASNLLPRSGSCNRITDEMRNNFFEAEFHRPPRVSAPLNSASKQQQQQPRSQSTSSSTNMPKKSASLTQTNVNKEHKSRRLAVAKNIAGVAASSSAERLFAGGDFCTGQGSVRNLVLSYEEFPSKERTESDFKIQQMRQERNRELFDAVEKSKIALSSRPSASGAEDCVDSQPPTGQANPPRSASYQMQKELSTISERTENSASLNGVLVAAASAAAAAGAGVTTSSSNTYLASPAANPTNMNSSKTTTTTKAIRNLDAQKFNFLDTSTGDNLSSKNFNSSTPIQQANNSTLRQTTTNSMLSSSASLAKPNTNRSSETLVTNTTSSTANAASTKRKTIVYKYNMNPAEDEGDDEEDDDDEEEEDDDDESDTETEDDPDRQPSDYEPENDEEEHFYRLKATGNMARSQEKPQFLETTTHKPMAPSARNEHVIRKNSQNKSHYSSQEDFLSSHVNF